MLEFEWDLAKELANIRKHKVTFTQAVESFGDPNGLLFTDEGHSKTERRFYWVGNNTAGKVLTTRFTRRGATIRIIGSAEWREFRRLYDEKAKQD